MLDARPQGTRMVNANTEIGGSQSKERRTGMCQRLRVVTILHVPVALAAASDPFSRASIQPSRGSRIGIAHPGMTAVLLTRSTLGSLRRRDRHPTLDHPGRQRAALPVC